MKNTLPLLFWLVAAAVVVGAHRALDGHSPLAAAAVALIALGAAALCYMRLIAPEATVSYALGVGILWFVLAIASELVMARLVGHEWFVLLGSPDHPATRMLFLFAWIFLPALFARHADA